MVIKFLNDSLHYHFSLFLLKVLEFFDRHDHFWYCSYDIIYMVIFADLAVLDIGLRSIATTVLPILASASVRSPSSRVTSTVSAFMIPFGATRLRSLCNSGIKALVPELVPRTSFAPKLFSSFLIRCSLLTVR